MEAILVPTDFSPAAINAVNYAVELVKFFNTKLILANASPVPASGYDNIVPVEMLSALQRTSKEGLEKLRNSILKKDQNLQVECYSEMGYAYEVIMDAAKKYKAELVVMGIVGEAGKIKEHLIGSTSVKIAQNIEIPVFIIPEKVTYHRIHKISFACDLEKTDESSIVYITKYFAKIFNAELEIVNVEPPNEEITPEQVENNFFVEKKLQNTKHKSVYITGTKVAKELENYFASHPTDVVMLNPKKHSIFHNLFNESVTKELAFHLPFPILTVTN